MHDAGYQTAYIGKWHMGEGNDEKRPGFDYWASHKGQGQYYDTPFNINGQRQVIKGYYTHVVTELATDWLKKARRPFSLNLGTRRRTGSGCRNRSTSTHSTTSTISEAGDRGARTGQARLGNQRASRRGTASTVRSTARKTSASSSGRITRRSCRWTTASAQIYETLRAMGELDNTIFLFASDNGFLLGEHASIDKRMHVGGEHPDSAAGAVPGRRCAMPRVVDRMVLNVDVAPSVLDLCGAPPLGARARRVVQDLCAGPETAGGARRGMYEYNFEKEFPYTPNVRGVRTDEWKYMHYPNGEGQPDTEKAELYDMKEDPLEKKNLIDAPEAQATLAELTTELLKIQRDTGGLPDQMPINPELRFEMPDAAIR